MINYFQIYYKPATCIIDGVMDTILAAFIASASKNLLDNICYIFRSVPHVLPNSGGIAC